MMASTTSGQWAETAVCGGEVSTEPTLPAVPEEVVVEFMMPHAFDTVRQALDLMLVCRAAHLAATTKRSFWEPFLWRRFDSVLLPSLQAAYGKYCGPLTDLLLAKYEMWPSSIEHDSTYGKGGVMAVVRSKFFVAQQVPDLWGHLNPISCSICTIIQAAPWWRCKECPSNPVICLSCREEELVGSDDSCDYDDDGDDGDDDGDENSEASDGSTAPDDVQECQEEEKANEVNDNTSISDNHPSGSSSDTDREDRDNLGMATKQDQAEDDGEQTLEKGNDNEDEQENEDDEEKKEETTDTHKPYHSMQLVIEKQCCSRCKEPMFTSWWCCELCVNKGRVLVLCDTCKSIEDGSPSTVRCYGNSKSEPNMHRWIRWTEGVEFINRWSIEAPHPALTFDQAWNEGVQTGEYTALRVLKLFSPLFTNYGCYVCYFVDRPSYWEGWIVNGAIRYGIKYTGWKHESHVFEGKFEDTQEGFPDGPGRREWHCGLKFTGEIHSIKLIGDKCTLQMIDGSKYEGSLKETSSFFATEGQGVVTLADGSQIKCFAETGHGRQVNEIHFWSGQKDERNSCQERFVLSTHRGMLEPVDEFEKTEEGTDSDLESDDDDPFDDMNTSWKRSVMQKIEALRQTSS